MDVVDADAHMAETAVLLAIAVVHGVVVIVLRACYDVSSSPHASLQSLLNIVVRAFNKALAVSPVLSMGNGLRVVVAQEIEVKLGIRVLELVDELHAQMLVEFDGSLRLHEEDNQYGIVQGDMCGIGGRW